MTTDLNLPSVNLKIRRQEDKIFVFDRLRRQYVRLTPEEWVRQHFVHYLIGQLHYPEGLLANEVCIRLGDTNWRCDSVLYDTELCPFMLIEYKAPQVPVTRKTFNQIWRYNLCLHASWLIVSNGIQHYCCRIKENGETEFCLEIPEYEEL